MKRTPTQLISASVKVTFDTSNSTHFTCKGEGKRYYALTVHHCRMSDRSVVSLYADDEKEVNRMRHVVNNTTEAHTIEEKHAEMLRGIFTLRSVYISNYYNFSVEIKCLIEMY